MATQRKRPSGTDGSDYEYRMVVEDKYKQLADMKMVLRKIISIQTMYIIIRGAWSILRVFNKEILDHSVVGLLAFGALASWVGTVGLKGKRLYSLIVYVIFTITAIILALLPLFQGKLIPKFSQIYQHAKLTDEFTMFNLLLLESGQDIVGIFIEALGIYMTYQVIKMQRA